MYYLYMNPTTMRMWTMMTTSMMMTLGVRIVYMCFYVIHAYGCKHQSINFFNLKNSFYFHVIQTTERRKNLENVNVDVHEILRFALNDKGKRIHK